MSEREETGPEARGAFRVPGDVRGRRGHRILVWLAGVLVALGVLGWRGAIPVAASDPPVWTIGVLAPTEGEYGSIGGRVLQAAQFAAAGAPWVRLRAYDTSGDPGFAVRAAHAEGVDVILGPVGDRETRAAAEVAQSLGIPMFGLSGRPGYEAPGRGVWRVRTSADAQADVLGGWAVQSGLGRTFAVVAPSDALGDQATVAFLDRVNASGGTVVQVVRYDPRSPDWTEVVDALTGRRAQRLVPSSDPAKGPPRARPTTGVRVARPDALFVPDFGRVVVDLLPMLEFEGWIGARAADPVELLGTSGWMDGSLARSEGLAAGARVAVVYHPDTTEPIGEAFALNWESRFAERPTELDAQVFDAASAVMLAVRDLSRPLSVEALRDRLRVGPSFVGACGPFSVDPTGAVSRPIGLWEIDGGGAGLPLGTIQPGSAQ